MNKILIIAFAFIAAAAIGFIVLTQKNAIVPQNRGNASSVTIPTTCSGKPIVALTEGPYYKASTPKKNDFSIDATPGEKLTITGYVYDTECKPLAGALLDFWQADGRGIYDNAGYILRGHQFTDRDGKYKLVTVIPGEYPGRTPHIHVKVRATDTSPTITTQLFVPGFAQNESDSIYDSSLEVHMVSANNATFNFVVNR